MSIAALIAGIAEVDKQREKAKKLMEGDRAKRKKSTHSQWAGSDGYFKRVGETRQEIPPGVYALADTQEGLFFVDVKPRTDELIRFPDTDSDYILQEIENFWVKEERFKKYGLPFKRGILLHGPPGSGKSCTLQMLAIDVINRGGIVLLFDSPPSFLQGYRHFRAVQPETPVVVFMEDLDAILENWKGKESMVLNMLDGAEELDKVVFVATTNFPERLGERVINRPSRFDRRFLIPHPSQSSRKLYIESLMKGDEGIDVDKWVRETEGFSMAHLKELFVGVVILQNDYKKVHTELEDMIRGPKLSSTMLHDGGTFKKQMDRSYI